MSNDEGLVDNSEAIARHREKNLDNWNRWAWHKNLVDVALSRYLQTPTDSSEEILKGALKTYKEGYEQKRFRTPAGSLYRADSEPPPETYRFR